MSGFNTPSSITVDPTPTELQPLQRVLADRLLQGLTSGREASPSPIFPGTPNVFSQLYGQRPGNDGGSFLPPSPVSSQTGSGQQNQFTNQYTAPGSGQQAFERFVQPSQGAVGYGSDGTPAYAQAGPGELQHVIQSSGGGNSDLIGGNDSNPPPQDTGTGPNPDNDPLIGDPGNDPLIGADDPENRQADTDPASGNQGTNNSAPFQPIPLSATFDLPGFQNPFDPNALFSAPLTTGQQDALAGFRNLFNPSQIVTNAQQANAVQNAIGGNQVFNPSQGSSLLDTIQPFDVRSSTQNDLIQSIMGGSANNLAANPASLPTNFDSAFLNQLSGRPVDVSGVQDASRQAFQSDLDEIIARERESASSFGLDPGAVDRSRGVIDAAGRAAANFNLGQERTALGAMENAAQRQLGAVGQVAPFLSAGAQSQLAGTQAQNIGTQNLLNLLPQVQAGDESALNAFLSITEPAAQRSTQALSMLPTFSNLPFQQAQALFGLENQARGIADTDLQRRTQEFARTQGGALNQILGLFGHSWPTQTGFGPSPLAQITSAAGPLASAFAL